ncbi:MAG: hypothetical protein H6618_05690 [Deltaproteobacteria bacterium]|nr:hypothetical protein [Deltaproteobacteria bacterium]
MGELFSVKTKEPVYYCRDLLKGNSLSTTPVFRSPECMIRTFHEIRQLCAGYMGATHTISTFFKILKYSGLDQHAVFRERFWRRYLKAGFISQGWLILAPEAEEYATNVLKLKPWQYGRLHKTRRIDPCHTVLLMRLDHLLVAEWSHLGKCRVWFQSNIRAPSLFRSAYDRAELTDYPDYIQQHYFSAKELWQKDLAAWMSARAFIPDCYGGPEKKNQSL